MTPAPAAPPTPPARPAIDPAAAAALVAPNATAPAPAPEPPRPVARTTVAKGEAVVGATVVGAPTEAQQPGAVTPVKPTATTTRPKPVKQAPTRKILPGDLICGECGEGNAPARNFCSRCGASLKQAVVAKKKWWQRLIPRRRRKTMEAGARPWKAADGSTKRRKRGGKLAKVYLKLRPIVAGALLLAGLVVGFTPNLREKVTDKIGDVKDSAMSKIQPSFVPLAPISIRGNGDVPENPVANVIDTNTLTFWVAPVTDPAPTIVVRFDEPFDLERIKVWNGAPEGFKDRERAAKLHFVFDNGQAFDLDLQDLPDGVEYEVKNGKGVQEVEIQVTDTFTSLTGTQLALSEIEFYFKK